MDRVSAFGGLEHGRDYKDGWEVAFGNEYKLNNKFTLIGSINYARTGAKNASFNDTEYALNSVTLGAGVRYNFDETLAITASVAHFIYEKEEPLFYLAGIYNDQEEFVIVTGEAEKEMKHIHHRTPLIIHEQDIQRYLSGDCEFAVDNENLGFRLEE